MAQPRISRADSLPMLDEARDYMRWYSNLREEDRSRHGSIYPLVVEVLRLGGRVSSSPNLSSLRLTAVQRSLVDVAWVLQQIGPVSAFIMEARLVRGRRSVEAAWSQIAIELSDATLEQTGRALVLSVAQLQTLFRAAVPLFVRLMHDRGIVVPRARFDPPAVPASDGTAYDEEPRRGAALLLRAGRVLHRMAGRGVHRRAPQAPSVVVIPANRAAELFREPPPEGRRDVKK